MKKQPEFQVHLSEDLLRQLLCLCEAEHRTLNNQILLLVRNSVQYFERAKGRIKPADLQRLDLSAYYGEANEQEDASEPKA